MKADLRLAEDNTDKSEAQSLNKGSWNSASKDMEMVDLTEELLQNVSKSNPIRNLSHLDLITRKQHSVSKNFQPGDFTLTKIGLMTKKQTKG